MFKLSYLRIVVNFILNLLGKFKTNVEDTRLHLVHCDVMVVSVQCKITELLIIDHFT